MCRLYMRTISNWDKFVFSFPETSKSPLDWNQLITKTISPEIYWKFILWVYLHFNILREENRDRLLRLNDTYIWTYRVKFYLQKQKLIFAMEWLEHCLQYIMIYYILLGRIYSCAEGKGRRRLQGHIRRCPTSPTSPFANEKQPQHREHPTLFE